MDKRLLLFVPTILSVVFVIILFGCTGNSSIEHPLSLSLNGSLLAPTETATPTPNPYILVTRDPNAPIQSPTPDTLRTMPTARTEPEYYTVQNGDTLAQIASHYGVSLSQIAAENDMYNTDSLEVGQQIFIPVPDESSQGSDFKIIPDSEFVNGPMSAGFDYEGFLDSYDGYLSHYSEYVGSEEKSGKKIVEYICNFYSINPRLLLSIIEYQSGWVTQSNPESAQSAYPMGIGQVYYTGLYYQLTWIANELNRGYYDWREEDVSSWVLADGSVVPISPGINAGTAGVQAFFAKIYGHDEWKDAVSDDGLFETYGDLFGYPFDYAVEPLIPADLTQPTFQLPFEDDDVWSFTSGPHGGWAEGSAWAALDFAPPGEPAGCIISDYWEDAVADGWIVRVGDGAVIEELDGDGIEQTGWTILYMHVGSTDDRIKSGQYVKAGEHIGHASCEGGYSNATHLHIARRYNGEWIPADGSIPFVMDGWVPSGTGVEYDGYLNRDNETLEAWDGRSSTNQIQR